MNKKIVAVALAVLTLAFVFVSCGKKDSENGKKTEFEEIEFTTDEDGELYITNVHGDLIPVTTGKDGSMELIDDLYTKPKEQADKEKESAKKESQKHQDSQKPTENTPGENQNPDVPHSDPETEAPTDSIAKPGGVEIGNDAPQGDGKEAVVVW